jgi:hypothetical protein
MNEGEMIGAETLEAIAEAAAISAEGPHYGPGGQRVAHAEPSPDCRTCEARATIRQAIRRALQVFAADADLKRDRCSARSLLTRDYGIPL